MATKRKIQSWMALIKKRQDAVAKERDNIDSLMEEMTMLKESCDRAWDALQDARDALSELV